MSAEQALRARALGLLAEDGELAALVHGVFDGVPRRGAMPYVAVGGAEGSDWGTKDRAGREVRLTLTLAGVDPAGPGAAAARIEAIVPALRGTSDGWQIVAARLVRSRFALRREGGWRQDYVLRCRCLAA
ncbi:tail completion protein gp17 [Sphingopyxis indica]|uniref:DUF3168 domain-containing protein n=1 Tax=Sphingopyxis indica TaxID=436663 RepID=A0A239JMX3_9SPHN|nr:DUF3168 domain-containing protein [Sphingopyxis indica]SNT06104.1 Protein of unknown function [Sphingopyxis indica]